MFRKKLGMTLVEVLVALIIGTISVAAMFYSYNIFNKSYQGIVEKASISKSGRNALSQLARELRNVGYKDINQLQAPLEEYLWKENNVSGFQIGSDSLRIFYDLSPKERVRIDYKLKKYQNSQDTFLSRSFYHWTCTVLDTAVYNCPVRKEVDEVFINNVEDFQIVFKDDTGKEVKPVNFGSGKTNQQRVKSIEVYLTVRSANEIFKKNKNWKINNADQNYSKNDMYTRETFFVSVYPRNIVMN